MNAVLRLAAVMAVVVILIGAWMFRAAEFEHDDLPRGFTSPVLAMELARSMEEVEMIAETQCPGECPAALTEGNTLAS